MSLQPGDTIGRYRILEQVGRGGMASVFRAFDAATDREVAVKVLPEFFAADAEFGERFEREAAAVRRLSHPNIVEIFDAGEDGGQRYFVSEFVEGGTLSARLGAPLPLDEAVAILASVASALDYAHQQGVLHRDLKPSNILMRPDGGPVLSDFGLARIADSDARLTRTGVGVGTPEYMAPEQALGREAGAAADLYSLAVVAYEMLTGRLPFSAETPIAVLLAHMYRPLPLPSTFNPSISKRAEQVLLKGLAKEPEDRYPTASTFVTALSEAAEATGVPAASGQAPRRSRLRIGFPLAMGLMAGGLLLAAIASLVVDAPVSLSSGGGGGDAASDGARGSDGPAPTSAAATGPSNPSPSVGGSPAACQGRDPTDSIRLVEATPAASGGLTAGSTEITLRLEYTVESYAFADLYVEATTSRDAPRWYGIGRSQRLPHGSGTVTMTGTVDAPESGWVEVQVSMYAPYPCGFVTLSRVSKFRYVVQGQGTSVGTQPSLVSSRQNCESAAASSDYLRLRGISPPPDVSLPANSRHDLILWVAFELASLERGVLSAEASGSDGQGGVQANPVTISRDRSESQGGFGVSVQGTLVMPASGSVTLRVLLTPATGGSCPLATALVGTYTVAR